MTLITQPLRQKYNVVLMLLVFLVSTLSQSVSWAAIDAHQPHHNVHIDSLEEKHVNKQANKTLSNASHPPCNSSEASAIQAERDETHAASTLDASSTGVMDCCGELCQCPVNVCASFASVAILVNALHIDINQVNTYRVESRVDAPSLISSPQFKPPKTHIAG